MNTDMKDVTPVKTETSTNEAKQNDVVMQNNIRFAATTQDIDLKSLGLTENDMKEIIEVKNNFGEVSGLSVAEYGKDISNGNQTDELLKLVKNKDLANK